MNKIKTAEFNNGHKRQRRVVVPNGCIIGFDTNAIMTIGSMLSILYKDRLHFFKVYHIKANTNSLRVYAVEISYWCHLFTQVPDFDIRSILNLQITHITDKNRVKKIDEESRWL
jgi:hypothetical protein